MADVELGQRSSSGSGRSSQSKKQTVCIATMLALLVMCS